MPARKYGVPIDMTRNEVQNALLQSLAADPGSPVEALHFYDNVVKTWKFHNGTSFIDVLARSTHTGTQLASTISDFDTQVRTNRLDQMASPTADVSLNSHKIASLANGTNPNDAVNKSQLDAVVQGITQKPTADAQTTANVPATYANGTAGVGATLTITATGVFVADGYTVGLNDRVFFNFQTAQLQNGLYLCTTAGAIGVSAVFTRDVDIDSSAEFKGAFILVGESSATYAGASYICNQQAPVVGTDAITFTRTNSGYTADGVSLQLIANQFSIKSSWAGQVAITTVGTIGTGTWQGTAVALGFGGTGGNSAATARANLVALTQFSQTIGDNSATSFNIDHNFNTRDVTVQVYDMTTFETIEASVVRSTVNRVVVAFTVAPATNAYRVVVQGLG